MNTLSKTQTAEILGSEQAFVALETRWSALVADPEIELSCADHLVYAALRGKDYRKGFTKVTNKVKLANGYRPELALLHALGAVHNRYYAERCLDKFEGTVTPEMIVALRSFLPAYPEEAEGSAYRVKEAVAA